MSQLSNIVNCFNWVHLLAIYMFQVYNIYAFMEYSSSFNPVYIYPTLIV